MRRGLVVCFIGLGYGWDEGLEFGEGCGHVVAMLLVFDLIDGVLRWREVLDGGPEKFWVFEVKLDKIEAALVIENSNIFHLIRILPRRHPLAGLHPHRVEFEVGGDGGFGEGEAIIRLHQFAAFFIASIGALLQVFGVHCGICVVGFLSSREAFLW